MIRFTCLLLSALLSCSVLGDEGSEATHLAPRIAACNVGRLYCYHEIVNDLQYPSQDLNNLYCIQTNDMRSCWGCSIWGCECKRGCWTSTWLCVGPYQYNYAASCDNDCKVGVCYEPEGFVKRRFEVSEKGLIKE